MKFWIGSLSGPLFFIFQIFTFFGTWDVWWEILWTLIKIAKIVNFSPILSRFKFEKKHEKKAIWIGPLGVAARTDLIQKGASVFIFLWLKSSHQTSHVPPSIWIGPLGVAARTDLIQKGASVFFKRVIKKTFKIPIGLGGFFNFHNFFDFFKNFRFFRATKIFLWTFRSCP